MEEEEGNPIIGLPNSSSSDSRGSEQPPSNLPHTEPTSVEPHEAYLTHVLEGQTCFGPQDFKSGHYQRRMDVVQDQDPTINSLEAGLLKQLLIHYKEMEKNIHTL